MSKKWAVFLAISAFVLLVMIIVYSRIAHIQDINVRVKKIYQSYQLANKKKLIDKKDEINQFIQEPFEKIGDTSYRGPRSCASYKEWPYQKTFDQWVKLVGENEFSLCLKTLRLKETPKGAFLARAKVFAFGLDQDLKVEAYSSSALYHLISLRHLGEYSSEDNQAVLSMALTIIEKTPTFYPAYKFITFALAMNKVAFKEDSKGVESAFRMTNKLRPEDSEMFELDIMYHFLTERDEKKMVNRLVQHSQKHPKDGSSLYLLAYYYWSQDDWQKSRHLLELAIKRKEEKRFVNTLAKMKELALGDTSQNVFYTPLKISFHHF